MNELLRFTSGSSIGVSFILPAKKEFVFYENKLGSSRTRECLRLNSKISEGE